MLAGGQKSISAYRPTLMIEVSQQHLERAGDSIQGFWKFLHNLNYAPFIIGQNLTELVPFTSQQDGDIFWLPNENR